MPRDVIHTPVGRDLVRRAFAMNGAVARHLPTGRQFVGISQSVVFKAIEPPCRPV